MPGLFKSLREWQRQLGSQIVGRIQERSTELAPAVEELRALLRHPRLLSERIEEKSPWLSRRFLGVASNAVEPFLIGMGLRIESLTEDRAEIVMPDIWRNHGEGGFVHNGALSALGEFAARMYWEHHLNLRHSEMKVRRTELRLLFSPQGLSPRGEMRAVYQISEEEREERLHHMRSEGRCEATSHIAIYDESARLAAELEVDWIFERHLALGSGFRG